LARVLVVDDDPGVTRKMKQLLEREGHDVVTATDGLEALAFANERDVDLAFIDIVMPKLDGLVLMRRLVERCPHVTIVVMSAYDDLLDSREEAFGPVLFLTKPFTLDEARIALDMALRREA
jgi:CheY-like chemotaxis protein